MDLQIVRLPDASAFMRRAEPFLLADEARHNLTLGVALTLNERPPGLVLPAPPFFATVERAEAVAATAIRQPPYGLVVSPAADLAADGDRGWVTALAELIRREIPDLPSVHAPPPVAMTPAAPPSSSRRRARVSASRK